MHFWRGWGARGSHGLCVCDPQQHLEHGCRCMYIFSTTASKREENLVCLLHELYPGDVGCFCVFFMNIVQLFNTHSIFLPANEPHCYLRGGCPSYYLVHYVCVQLKWGQG